MILILPRSSLSVGFSVESIPRVIDSDYRGTIAALLCNYGQHTYTIRLGDFVAQFVILSYTSSHFVAVPGLIVTGRSAKGFASIDMRQHDKLETSPKKLHEQAQ